MTWRARISSSHGLRVVLIRKRGPQLTFRATCGETRSQFTEETFKVRWDHENQRPCAIAVLEGMWSTLRDKYDRIGRSIHLLPAEREREGAFNDVETLIVSVMDVRRRLARAIQLHNLKIAASLSRTDLEPHPSGHNQNLPFPSFRDKGALTYVGRHSAS